MQKQRELDQKYIDQQRQSGFRPVAMLCCVHKGKLLMVYKEEHALWQVPQGGIEPGESIVQAATRELEEELGQAVADSKMTEIQVLGEASVTFPPKSQNARQLVTDDGITVSMKGKHYFFCKIELQETFINLDDTEFDKYDWYDYLAALGITNQIYQQGKRRITQQILLLLKQHQVIE